MKGLVRTGVAAIVGAAVGAACLVALYSRNPGLTFEMDKPLPPFISGIYGGERDALGTFAWTSARVEITLPGLDRRAAWACTVRLRGARAEGMPLPSVEVVIDGARSMLVPAANDYHDLGFTLPPASSGGATVALNVAPTFTPGTADTRILGVQVDRLACRPSAGLAWPPWRAIVDAAAAAGVFAAAFAWLGLPLTGALLVGVVVAAGQAAMMVTAGAAYGAYPRIVFWIAVWVTAAAGAILTVCDRRRLPLRLAARSVFAVSAVALFVKLIGLLHPAKPVIDSLFHAHRFDSVLAGGYFFTQPFAGGVQMPYAIGLYMFAAPWAWVTDNHVALVWTVTAAADVVAGALLYPVMVRAWGDRRAAALAVLAFQLVPHPWTTLGNANLTNMFGQSAALAVMAAAVAWALDPARYGRLLGLTALVALAFCSHVTTVTTLSFGLGVLVVLYTWRGDASRRRAAASIVIAAAAALGAAWLLFYRHFAEVFRAAFARMFSGGAPPPGTEATAAEIARGYMSTSDRVLDLVGQAITSAGWPLLMLGAIGVWSLGRRGTRDRLVSALFAWAAVWLVFSASTVFAKVDREYVRYAAEFLGRINLATAPLIAILAGVGASAGWSDACPPALRRPLRWLAIALVAWATVLAAEQWLAWFSR